MHLLGKIFLGLTIILALVAVLLTSRLINTRNYWMQEIDGNKKTLAQNAERVQQQEEKLAKVKEALIQQRQTWDTLFVAPNSRVDQQGTLLVGIGPQQGFGIVPQGAPLPIVHAFMPGPNGGMLYAGPFQVALAQGGQAKLTPLFRVYPNTVAKWPAGTWHLWQVIPSYAGSQITELTSLIAEAHEELAARQSTLKEQQAAVAEAKAALEEYRQELLGNPQGEKVPGSPELKIGLVAALKQANAARNASIAELDRLRHAIDQTYRQLQQLVSQSQQSVQALRRQSPEQSAVALDVSATR